MIINFEMHYYAFFVMNHCSHYFLVTSLYTKYNGSRFTIASLTYVHICM